MRAATSSRSLEDLGRRKALPRGHGLRLWVASDGITLGTEIDHLGLIDVAGVTQPVDSVGSSTITSDVAFEIDGLAIRLERSVSMARMHGPT